MSYSRILLRELFNMFLPFTASRLSKESDETVGSLSRELYGLMERFKSNTDLDTQKAVLKISKFALPIQFSMSSCIVDEHQVMGSLRYAKDAVASESKKCLPDTRLALLSTIEDWALDLTRERILLLHGAAGKGKSAIANTVAKRLKSRRPFFAFNRSVPDRSLTQLIPTWTKQLAESNPRFLGYLHTLNLSDLESSDVTEQRDSLLIGGLAAMESNVPLVFIIDALDECPERDADQLLRFLRGILSLPNLSPFVRFLFTCRSNENILQAFKDHHPLQIPIDHTEGTVDDIRKFVRFQLDNTSFADMVGDVATAAESLFECAAVLCRELKSPGPKDREELVQRLRQGHVISLFESYRIILDMYFGKSSPKVVQVFRRLMAWILLVQSPQSHRVFRGFGDVLLPEAEQKYVGTVLSWLGSLLSGTASDDPISPLHTSLRDFLSNAAESGAFFIDLGQRSQEELALACLRVMNTCLEFNICKLPTPFMLNSDIEDLPQRLERYISPALRYACVATAHHLLSSLPSVTAQPKSSPDSLDLVQRTVCTYSIRYSCRRFTSMAQVLWVLKWLLTLVFLLWPESQESLINPVNIPSVH